MTSCPVSTPKHTSGMKYFQRTCVPLTGRSARFETGTITTKMHDWSAINTRLAISRGTFEVAGSAATEKNMPMKPTEVPAQAHA